MPVKRIKQTRRKMMRKIVWRTRLVFWTGAIIVGLSSALLALGSEYAHEIFKHGLSISPYLPFVLTPFGLILITFLTRRYFDGAEGSGIPQVIAALQLQNRPLRTKLLSFPIAVGKFLMVLLGLLCGASIGREGPSVHMSASIMYALHRYARFPHRDIGKGLILAGSAAGLAAAFNTPLAGIVFAIEEMNRSFEEKTNGTVLFAVVLSGLIALSLLGNYRYFGHVNTELSILQAIFPTLVCAVAGGLLGGLFSQFLILGGKKITPFRNHHPYILAGICGLGVAVIGVVASGTTYGTGYAEAQMAISGEPVDSWFPALKMLATLVSYWSGIPGGIFAPSLSVGAGLGAEMANWFPDLPYSSIVLLGMVAYFSGVVQTPVTAVVILMEMTANETMLLPLMATAILANGVSKWICPTPIYRALSEGFLNSLHLKKDKVEKS